MGSVKRSSRVTDSSTQSYQRLDAANRTGVDMARSQSVYAIVANWGGGYANVECIQSLLDQGLPQQAVVFVDNASEDGSADLVERTYPDVPLIRNSQNLGYGHANNQGVELALKDGAEFIFLVNNDIVLPQGTLDVLLAKLNDDESLGVVGPRVLVRDRPEMVWAAGGFLTYRENLTTLLGHFEPDGERWKHTFPVDFIPGCSLLTRREVFDQVGFLDGEFFAYHEDVDFCLRVASAGWGVSCVGEAASLHAAHAATGGGYNPRRKYMMGVNAIWFLRRHGTPVRWARFFIFDILSLAPLLLVAPFRGQTRSVLAKARGMFDGLCGRRVTAELIESGSSLLW
jgi:GT2 family glycosyltransferase